ncbi:tRNA nucleotidyl transferase [Gammaproteobacteria bacterium]|nr:tRNA nucleotidyl transferase [Gammaproteobacteria bacterium]
MASNLTFSFETYLVGGAVRDQLLNLPIIDRDWVVVGANYAQMLEHGFKSVGKDFPVFLHPDTHEEYALARQERKTGKGYHGFSVIADGTVSLEEDLSRRDLTINAIAKACDGRLIDPYNGIDDLNARVLRHVSIAFKEDPVRVLRLARFYARLYDFGFKIATETKQLISEMIAQGELNYLSPERIWIELSKALNGAHPDQFIACLRELGALKIILPEVDALFGIPQRPEYHPEIDSGLHTLMVMRQAALLNADADTLFACLCHDLGKATTPTHILPKHTQHESRGAVLAKKLAQRLKIPNDTQTLAIKVAKYHLYFHTLNQLRAVTILKLLLSLDALRRPLVLDQFILACIADERGRLCFEDREILQGEFLKECLIALKGIDAKQLLLTVDPAKIPEIIHLERLKKIKNVIKDYTWS